MVCRPTLLAVIAIVMGLLALMLAGAQSTRLAPDQIRPAIAVVEWQKCEWAAAPSVSPTPSCTGMELFRFRLSDGTTRGPFIAWPAPPEFKIDASKWKPQPLEAARP